jgi:formylglycine-generating enzyme required for sulfatase activity
MCRRAERERRAAARRRRRVQFGFGALGWLLLVGLVAWINQDYLMEQWRWFSSIRPYMLSQFRPHVLTAEAERALKPGDIFRECAKDCPEMVVLPAGMFVMGSPPDEKGRHESEGPQHEVRISKPFAVSRFEATFDNWEACVSYGDCPAVGDSGFGHGQQPVINLSWADAQHYVAWLVRMTGKAYRLLSEAEWEYAARAGTQTTYSWGNEIGKGNANCKGCGSQWDDLQTAPVGSFAANPFGLHDMHGNVFEWVEDAWHDGYQGAPSDGSVWIEAGDVNRRRVRGGSWDYDPNYLRSATRAWFHPDERDGSIGFRVARALDQ